MAMGTLLNGHKRPTDHELWPWPAPATNLRRLLGDSQTESSRGRRTPNGCRPLDSREDVLPPGEMHQVPRRGRERLPVRHHQSDAVRHVGVYHRDGPEPGWVAEEWKERLGQHARPLAGAEVG